MFTLSDVAYMEGSMDFSDYFDTIFKESQMTLKEFVDNYRWMTGEYVSKSYVSRLRNENIVPSPKFCLTVSKMFGISVDQILDVAKMNKLKQCASRIEKMYKI